MFEFKHATYTLNKLAPPSPSETPLSGMLTPTLCSLRPAHGPQQHGDSVDRAVLLASAVARLVVHRRVALPVLGVEVAFGRGVRLGHGAAVALGALHAEVGVELPREGLRHPVLHHGPPRDDVEVREAGVDVLADVVRRAEVEEDALNPVLQLQALLERADELARAHGEGAPLRVLHQQAPVRGAVAREVEHARPDRLVARVAPQRPEQVGRELRRRADLSLADRQRSQHCAHVSLEVEALPALGGATEEAEQRLLLPLDGRHARLEVREPQQVGERGPLLGRLLEHAAQHVQQRLGQLLLVGLELGDHRRRAAARQPSDVLLPLLVAEGERLCVHRLVGRRAGRPLALRARREAAAQQRLGGEDLVDYEPERPDVDRARHDERPPARLRLGHLGRAVGARVLEAPHLRTLPPHRTKVDQPPAIVAADAQEVRRLEVAVHRDGAAGGLVRL
mmetsp:Transcript_24844/g.80241  ORF Transcript_24844/g.80241 Transcript_24844/m.80241 type:complete len:451 (+) Transcript_24844:16-1368(+)